MTTLDRFYASRSVDERQIFLDSAREWARHFLDEYDEDPQRATSRPMCGGELALLCATIMWLMRED